MSEDEPMLEPEPEEEEQHGGRVRHVKKYEIMLQECHDFVMAGKRLPKLHSRWLYNRYINCQTSAMANIVPHNRMVDELREAQRTIQELRQHITELESEVSL